MSAHFGSVITLVIWICLLTGVTGTDPVLSPSPYIYVEENQNMTLTCTYSGTEDVEYCIWKKGSFPKGTLDRNCNPPAPINGSLYAYTCPSNNVFQWTVKRVTREHNGIKWKCEISINGVFIPSEQTTVVVAVPITSVSMTTPTVTTVSIIENTTSVQFICVTSAGRPQATVGWYIKPATPSGAAVEVTGGSIQTITDADNLTIVIGKLSYSPTRENQGWQIYCTASNVLNKIKESTRKPILNILFSPTIPTLTYEGLDGPSIHSSSVNAIRGDDVKIGCTSRSNPEPAYRWSSQSGTSQILTINNIQVNTTRTCTSTNTMVPTVGTGPGQTSATSMVFINVMYGPSVPSLFYNSSSIIPATVNVIEGSTFPTITCSGSSSNPSPSFYSWSGSVTSSSGSLNLVNIGKHQAGIFTCHVHNTMVRPYGDSAPVVGRNNKTFTLNVLYSPRLSETGMTNITTAQHETASLNVTVVANPEPSSYVWAKFTKSTWTDLTSSSDVHISSRGLQSNITIVDVKKSDYGQYRLTVTNTVDVFQQVFYVTKPHKPGSPTNLRYRQDSVTEWSAFVQWEPGFDGGLPQTFHVYYRPIYTTVWKSVNLHQTLDASTNVTLTGLTAGSTYEVQVYAINDIGNSSTDIVLFATKGTDKPSPTQDSVNVPAGVVGGVAGGLVVVVLVISAIIFSRKYKIKIVKKHDDVKPDVSCTSTTGTVKDTTKRKGATAPTGSVRINNTAEDSDMSPQYTELERRDIPTDSYASLQNIELTETKQSTYENLKV